MGMLCNKSDHSDISVDCDSVVFFKSLTICKRPYFEWCDVTIDDICIQQRMTDINKEQQK